MKNSVIFCKQILVPLIGNIQWYKTVNWYMPCSLLILPLIVLLYRNWAAGAPQNSAIPKHNHTENRSWVFTIHYLAFLVNVVLQWDSLHSALVNSLPTFGLSEQFKCSHHIHTSFLHQRVCVLHRHLPGSHHPRCVTPPQHEESGNGWQVRVCMHFCVLLFS